MAADQPSKQLQSHLRAVPELPNEVFLMIIQRCPGSTLKRLRLVSKTLAQMTEPYLWRRVVLVPNDHCILGFIKALKRSKVLRHVTRLTYDGRFGAFYTKLRDITPLPDPQAERTKELVMLDRIHQGHFKPYEDMSIEVACLAKALRLLPNLKRVCIREHEDDDNQGEGPSRNLKTPWFYLRVCRSIRINPKDVPWTALQGPMGRSYTKGFFTAAFSADCRFQKLKAKGMDGRAMFGVVPMKSSASYQQVSIFKNIMDGLRDLELAFRNDTLISTANHLEAISQLLKSAKKLKRLKLRLTDCSTSRIQFSDEEMNSDFGGLVESANGTWASKPLMPKLETLIIDAGLCHDEDLIHFLKIHSRTLSRLELSNITLLGSDDRRECWVKLIKHLKSELKLVSISFSGWFSNGGRQQWSVAKDPVGSERLKARVESYVVDRRIRDCPLEPVAIKPNECDVEKPANGEEFEGDLTWTMVYSSRYASVDWELTEPSFGIDAIAASNQSSEPGALTPPPHSDSDSWEELPDEPAQNPTALQGALDQPPTFGTLVDIVDPPANNHSWTVLSSSSLTEKSQEVVPPATTLADATFWTFNPASPSFMA